MKSNQISSKRKLGQTDIEITSIGLGTWQFSGGRKGAGFFWPAFPAELINNIIKHALEGGINWFDTAEIYGKGRSEENLANGLIAAHRKDGDVVIATKWHTSLRTARSIPATIDIRLRCLKGFSIDLYQVHTPLSLSTVEAEMNAMADLVEAGKIKSVGISNFPARLMRRAQKTLAQRGLPLASNQVAYSLMNRKIERNGVLDMAKEFGTTIIAWSPLAQGVLTGKFHDNPALLENLSWPRKWLPIFRNKSMKKSRSLIEALKEIADKHNATPAEVALNWLTTFHGETVVAIPGATKIRQVEQNIGAMHLTLSSEEMSRLDELSRSF
jgi:aryl-alcohol dehydrogenase-like predicted oxidoreductase